MILFQQFIPHKNISFNKLLIKKFILLSIGFVFLSCSPTKRILNDDENFDSNLNKFIRVLLSESTDKTVITVNSKIYLSDGSNKLAEINSGNSITITCNLTSLSLIISDKVFSSDIFFLDSFNESDPINVNGKKYRGGIKLFIKNSNIEIINQINLEDYVKGVMTKEMPVGNGSENYQSLKAFSICVRTYALNKIKEQKDFFDIYPDTRDQVYGGVDGETEYTNKIVDETTGQILTFDNKPATIFYHSTCGGFTENVKNVFGKESIPYLISIEDGSDNYCKISPRYEWIENYSEENFIDKLFKSKLIENKAYFLSKINVNSRFESGRVNELQIILLDKSGKEKNISLFGNSIRSVIRTSDNKSILKSNFFDIELNQNKDVIINGKGSGHGVGMCQWGAIGQSKLGIDYLDILNHYFPGTKIKNNYD